MIETALKVEGVVIDGPGIGQGHMSKDMSTTIGLDNDMAWEVEVTSEGGGKLLFAFASVSKPGPVLLLNDGGERDMTEDGEAAAGTYYTAEQLTPGADETFELDMPDAGGVRVFTVPNFKSTGRYLHFWFNVPDDGGVASATAVVLAKARGGSG
jgi:hypothetical protein